MKKVFGLIGLVLMGLGWWGNLEKEKIEKLEVEVKTEIPTRAEIKSVRVAVMADIHLDWESLEKGLEMAKIRENRLVIIAGDLGSLGKREELKAARDVLDEGGVKYYVLPGNHDLWWGKRVKQDIFGEIFGYSYKSIKVEDVKFLLINNGDWEGLGEDQKNWIDKEAEECSVMVCVAVMHMPLNHAFTTHIMGEDSQKTAQEAKWLFDRLKEAGVKQIIAGHLHYATSYNMEGMRTNIVGAISRENNNQMPRYTEFLISSEKIEREVVEVEE